MDRSDRGDRGERRDRGAGRYASNRPKPVPAPKLTAMIKFQKKEDNDRREGQ